MDAKTAEALEASIAKWKRNAEAVYSDEPTIGATTCPLCEIYNRTAGIGACTGCPVMGATGRKHCKETPWDDASARLTDWKFDARFLDTPTGRARDAFRDAFRAAALAEVAFLESLREPVAVEDAA